jgi:hypothetical protein
MDDYWAHQRGVKFDFIRPGKPVENAYIESYDLRASAHEFSATVLIIDDDADVRVIRRCLFAGQSEPVLSFTHRSCYGALEPAITHGQLTGPTLRLFSCLRCKSMRALE